MRTTRRHRLAGAFLLLWISILFGGCGSDKSTEPSPPPPADVNAFLAEVPRWSEFSPTLADADEPIGEPVTGEEEVAGTTYECRSTPYSITQTPDRIVTLNPDSEILWPGVLLQGKGFAEGLGSLAELPIRQRAPLALSIDILSADNTRTVDAPTLASVQQAIGGLIEAAHNAGHTAGSNVLFTQERMHSVDQALLKMGLSAKYSGAEISAGLGFTHSAEKTNVTAYFVQRMFTVSVVLPESPAAFFSDAFTGERLQEEVERGRMGPDNPPVFVSNVAYGRMLVFSLSSSSQVDSIWTALNVVLESGGQGGGGEMEAGLKRVLQQASIRVVTIGGDASHALALIRSGNISSFFATDAPLTTARPISYTVRSLADNSVAKVSETREYSLTECLPADFEPTGAEYEITLNHVTHAEARGWPCVGWRCVPLSEYNFWLVDANASTRVAQFDRPLGPFICEGDTWEFEGRPQLPIKVRLHFDRRDQVRLHGSFESLEADRWNFDLRWRGSIPTGQRNSSVWDSRSGQCARFRIHYLVRKTGDLFD